MKIKIWILCGVMLAGWWGVSASWGVDYTWNGSNGDWNEETNWTPTGVPFGNGDSATINSGSVTGFSGEYPALRISLSGTLTASDDVELPYSFLNLHAGGNFSSQNTVVISGSVGHIMLTENGTQFSASEVQLKGERYFANRGGTATVGTFKIEEGAIEQYSGVANVGTLSIGSADGWGIYRQYGGVANVGTLSMNSDNSQINFYQGYGEALTYRDGDGKLVGGITISETGAADLSQGTMEVVVRGLQFTNSNIAYTLIENGVSALPANVFSNVYDLRISDDDLVAILKTDLTSTGVFGAVKPTGNSLTLYTNLEGDDFDDLRSWLDENNMSLDVEKGTEPSSFLLSLTGMGDWDSLIWDLSRFDDHAMLSTTPFSPQPSVPVPEPATWFLLLLGTAFLLKRRMVC